MDCHINPPQDGQSKPFPFGRLPSELRDLIYEALLLRPKLLIRFTPRPTGSGPGGREGRGIDYTSKATACDESLQRLPTNPNLSPSILRLNRQTHHEALPVLYGRNTFAFPSISSLRHFLFTAGRTGVPLLRNIEILTTGRWAFWEPMTHLLRTEKLNSLVIQLGPADVRETGWSEVVLEVADFVARRATTPAECGVELGRISFVCVGEWVASGNLAGSRPYASRQAPEQVRARIEKRLRVMGALSAA